MRRRQFIAGLGSAAAWPLRVQQADRVRHVGALMNGVPGDSSLPARLLSEPDDECRVLSVREQPSAWIAQDLQPSLSDL
jgi:hypothetical protein